MVVALALLGMFSLGSAIQASAAYAGGSDRASNSANNPFGLKALPYKPGDTGATGIMFLPDIPDSASCSIELITLLPPLSGYKVIEVGKFLGTSYGIFYDVVHDQPVWVTVWHAVPGSSCVDLVVNILNTPPPWASTPIPASELPSDLPPVYFPSNPLNGPGAPGANNPTTPTQSTPAGEGSACTGPLGQVGVIRNGQCYLGTAM